MTKETVKVAIIDGKTMTDVTELPKSGQPVRIKAVANGKYVLAEGDKGFAPENITVKRVGKDLHVALEGSDPDQPQLIIEGFFDQQSQLVGMAEDGSYYEYIAADAEQDHSAPFLIDQVTAPQVLGGESLSGMNGLGALTSGLGWLGAGLIAAGVLGAGLALGAGGGGGGSDDHDNGSGKGPATPSLGSVEDNVGGKTGPIDNGGITDDATPTFSGGGTPGNVIIIKDGDKVIGEVVVGDDGHWEFTPPVPLPEGSHEIVVVEKDSAGNESAPSEGFEIIIDVTAPGKSVIGDVQDNVGVEQGHVGQNERTDDNTPTLIGTAEAGSTVEVYNKDLKIGETIANPDGTWAFTPDVALPDGKYDFTTVAVDKAGNRGLPSDPYSVIVDTSIVSIIQVVDDQGTVTGDLVSGSATDDTMPTFNGKAIPNSAVNLYDNGVLLGSTTSDALGNWTFTPTTALVEGDHSFTATVVPASGIESMPTAPFDLEVDLTAPVLPVLPDGSIGGIDVVTDNVGSTTGPIGNGGSTDDDTPTLGGGGLEPGDKVTIYDGGQPIGEAIVDENGNWTYTPDPLGDGKHDFSIIVTDPAGNSSNESDPYTVIVDTTAPLQPVITSVYDDQGNLPGNLASGDTTDDAQPDISGTAEPGSTVSIYDGITKLGEAQVDANGNWTFTPPVPLPDGPHTLTVEAEDAAGNVSVPSAGFDFTLIPGGAPVAPVITDLFDDVGTPQTLNSGDVTNDTRPTINGTGVAGSTITVSANGVLQGTTTVKADGTWSFDQPTDLPEGPVTYSATETNAAGNVSADSNVYSVIVDITAPILPGGGTGGIDSVIDDNGATPEPVLDGGITNDNTPTLGGGGLVPGDKVTVIDNGNAIGEAIVDANGDWTFTPPVPLPEGSHDFTIEVTDPAGNTSNESDPYNVIIDTSAPAQPVITSVYDDQGNLPGNLNSGDTTDDAQPDISGTAEPGSTVSIYDGITRLGEAQVDANGNWTFTPPTPLPDGPHTLTVEAKDAAGNVSQPSAGFDFTLIPGGAPVAPVITDVFDDVGTPQTLNSGDVTNDTRPTINGTGVAGSTITVSANGLVQGTTVVQADGTWSFDQPTDLPEGPVTYTATETNAAGNISADSNVYSVIVDITAPILPGGGTGGIDTVIDDNGAIPEVVNNGGLTNDNTPTVEGGGLVPGDKVTIIDNGNPIGEAIVDANGNWTFTPPGPIAEGNHDFTIVVTDPAGNTSNKSDPYTVIVDTSAPLTQAVVTSMGKDSGSNSSDFLTNDGSAGRLIQGSLTAALAADEKVQVSVNGGSTWLDAVLNGDGTWSFVDETAHNTDWEIQTRVVDGAGNAGVKNLEVVKFDTSPLGVPDSVSRNGDVIDVVISTTGAVVGVTLYVNVGDMQLAHVLTQAEISAGAVSLNVPAGTTGVVGTFIEDEAGNVSDIRLVSVTKVEAFNSLPTAFNLAVNQTYDFGAFTVTNTKGSLTNTASYSGSGNPGLWIGEGTVDSESVITLDDPATNVSFMVKWYGGVIRDVVSFVDQSGNVIDSIVITGNGLIDYTAPSNVMIAEIHFEVFDGNGIGIDDFTTVSGDVIPHPDIQAIVSASKYFGENSSNTFTLGDVTLFNSSDMGIHGNGGLDTLELSGSGQVLDLTNIGDKLSSIEVIDLTGSGNNTLKLSLEDVLNNGETDLFHVSGKTQMKIDGDVGDVVDLEGLVSAQDPGVWTAQGPITVGGVSYNVYSHSSLDAELLVQQGVTTNLV